MYSGLTSVAGGPRGMSDASAVDAIIAANVAARQNLAVLAQSEAYRRSLTASQLLYGSTAADTLVRQQHRQQSQLLAELALRESAQMVTPAARTTTTSATTQAYDMTQKAAVPYPSQSSAVDLYSATSSIEKASSSEELKDSNDSYKQKRRKQPSPRDSDNPSKRRKTEASEFSRFVWNELSTTHSSRVNSLLENFVENAKERENGSTPDEILHIRTKDVHSLSLHAFQQFNAWMYKIIFQSPQALKVRRAEKVSKHITMDEYSALKREVSQLHEENSRLRHALKREQSVSRGFLRQAKSNGSRSGRAYEKEPSSKNEEIYPMYLNEKKPLCRGMVPVEEGGHDTPSVETRDPPPHN